MGSLKRFPIFLKNYFNRLPYHISKEGKSFYPHTIFIIINSICNLRCKICDVGRQEQTHFTQNMSPSGMPELKLTVLEKLVRDVKFFNPLIAVTSTEPLLFKNLVPFAYFVKKNSLKLQITTNGFLLPEHAKELSKTGLDYLWVSLDGPKEIHNSLRGIPGSFERAIKGVKKIQKFKKGYGLKRPEIGVNCTISKENSGDLYEFLKSMRDLGIKDIIFSHLNFVTKEQARIHNQKFGKTLRVSSSSVTEIDPKEINTDEIYYQIKKIKNDFPKTVFAPPIFTKKEIDDYYKKPFKVVYKKACLVPWKVGQIAPNGDVIPLTRCFHYVAGNIYQNSFTEIWNGQKMQKFRKILRRHKIFPACTRCCGIL